jgi:uncharacterized protein (DUF2062 family)
VFHRILHADDTPHRIALGLAIGMFVALTPTIGLQMVIALAVAAALRANKAACIPVVWITNPFTAVPIYSFCWLLGAKALSTNGEANLQAVIERIGTVAALPTWSRLLDWGFWSGVITLLVDLGTELWLGCCLAGVVSGGLVYGLSRWGIATYRRRRAERKMRRDERRQRSFIKPVRAPVAIGCRKPA